MEFHNQPQPKFVRDLTNACAPIALSTNLPQKAGSSFAES